MTNDDTAPHDLAAEQAVLGTCMTGPHAVEQLRTYLPDPDAFYRTAHQTIYTALCELTDNGKSTDPVTLKDHLAATRQLNTAGGAPYLFNIFEIAGKIGGDPTWHANIVARHARHRHIVQTVDTIHGRIHNADDPDILEEVLSTATSQLNHLATPTTSGQDPILSLYQTLDWKEAFTANPNDIDWLVEPFIERGRSVAIYSPAKTGKSLLTLEIAAAIATGRPVLGNPPREPQPVLYVDIENSTADITDRLTNLGYGPEELDQLHYLSFPNLPTLDSAAGGRHLTALAAHYQPALVIIDTVSRVIEGSENDADTFAALYRHALAPLKGMGIAVIRLDHSGKDLERGQRGSSAKNADVDAVWLLVKQSDTALYLKREMSRTNHGVPLIELRRRPDPLRHELLAGGTGLPPKVEQIVEHLNDLGIPADLGRDAVREELATAGIRVRNDVLSQALAVRRQGGWR